MNVFLIFLGGAATLIGISWARHLQKLKQHEGVNRAEFIAYFSPASVAPEVAGAVYDYFRQLGVWKNFRSSPSDTLEGTYKTVDEDVDDALLDILKHLGYEVPNSRIRNEWQTDVRTLDDVVRWVDWVRKKQTSAINKG